VTRVIRREAHAEPIAAYRRAIGEDRVLRDHRRSRAKHRPEKEGVMGTIVQRSLGVVVIGLGVSLSAAAQSSVVPPPADQLLPIQDLFATKIFQDRVADYVTLHRLLEGPPLRPTTNIDEIHTNMQLLANRLVVARQHARQGDVITADVARMFRRRIATCLSPEDWAAILAKLAEDEEGVPMPPVTIRVNMPWPEQIPYGFVPTPLLYALPQLPPELQYRIIGRSLVLWDHHANLVVDFLPGAFTS
jgi:hypothetical protein